MVRTTALSESSQRIPTPIESPEKAENVKRGGISFLIRSLATKLTHQSFTELCFTILHALQEAANKTIEFTGWIITKLTFSSQTAEENPTEEVNSMTIRVDLEKRNAGSLNLKIKKELSYKKRSSSFKEKTEEESSNDLQNQNTAGKQKKELPSGMISGSPIRRVSSLVNQFDPEKIEPRKVKEGITKRTQESTGQQTNVKETSAQEQVMPIGRGEKITAHEIPLPKIPPEDSPLNRGLPPSECRRTSNNRVTEIQEEQYGDETDSPSTPTKPSTPAKLNADLLGGSPNLQQALVEGMENIRKHATFSWVDSESDVSFPSEEIEVEIGLSRNTDSSRTDSPPAPAPVPMPPPTSRLTLDPTTLTTANLRKVEPRKKETDEERALKNKSSDTGSILIRAFQDIRIPQSPSSCNASTSLTDVSAWSDEPDISSRENLKK